MPTFVVLFANRSVHAAIIKPTRPKDDSSYTTEMRALVGLQAGNGAGPLAGGRCVLCNKIQLNACAVGLICQ